MLSIPAAVGLVEHLCVNGELRNEIAFGFHGLAGDVHAGYTRKLSGHDGGYIATSKKQKGQTVFNWRTWTAISHKEVSGVGLALDASIPPGCLLENICISGIPGFSQLAPTSRLVFPEHGSHGPASQVILAVWEENGPCKGVGDRLAKVYPDRPGISSDFVRAAVHRRGVMGFVLSPGVIQVGDQVLVYPPVK